MQTRKQEINHIISLIQHEKWHDLKKEVELYSKEYKLEIARSIDPISRGIWNRIAKIEKKELVKPINYEIFK